MFKKPKVSDLKSTAIDVVSATGGGMLSEGVMSIVPAKYKAEHEDLIRGGLALASAGGAAALKGNSTQVRAIKMALVGMTIAQVRQLVKTYANKAGIGTAEGETDTAKKFVAGLFGLACPCDQANQNTVLARMPMLNRSLNGGAFDYQAAKLQNLGVERSQMVAANAFD